MKPEISQSQIITLLLLLIVGILSVFAYSKIKLWLKKKNSEKDIVRPSQEDGIVFTPNKVEEPEKKFFLRRINDFWVPLIITGAYIILNILVLGVQQIISFQAASGLMAIAFNITKVSWVIPIVKLLLKIYFPILDNYTDAEKLHDFDSETDRKTRLWIYVALVCAFSYIVVA